LFRFQLRLYADGRIAIAIKQTQKLSFCSQTDICRLVVDRIEQLQNTGVAAGPCVNASFSGSAVEQKAHSADKRPMIQCVRPQPGQ